MERRGRRDKNQKQLSGVLSPSLWPWTIREFLFFFPHAAAKR